MSRRPRVSSILAASVASVVVTAAAASCGGGKSPAATTPIGNDTTGGDAPLAADGAPAEVTEGALWSCQISDYDPQPCKFHRDGEGWRLTKLLGSQRFDGATTFDGASAMGFVGQFFCPWGACDEAMDLSFARDGDTYKAEFSGDTISVRWDAALAGEWGGAGYGGLTGREAE